ncbi:MAG: hypothetical protein H7248_00915 [Microbacteriaceae bacterium]|nr:hypothetical protein [Microbacteriaceae bacterium]
MRPTTTRRLLVGLTTAALLAGPVGAANAYGSWGGGSYYGSSDGKAVTYINPDMGAATANNDVDPNSSCFRADQYDKQMFSPI